MWNSIIGNVKIFVHIKRIYNFKLIHWKVLQKNRTYKLNMLSLSDDNVT